MNTKWFFYTGISLLLALATAFLLPGIWGSLIAGLGAIATVAFFRTALRSSRRARRTHRPAALTRRR